jgi:hypothetical protein
MSVLATYEPPNCDGALVAVKTPGTGAVVREYPRAPVLR